MKKINLILAGFIDDAHKILHATPPANKDLVQKKLLAEGIKIASADNDPGNHVTADEEQQLRNASFSRQLQLPQLTQVNIRGYLASPSLSSSRSPLPVENFLRDVQVFQTFFEQSLEKLNQAFQKIDEMGNSEEINFSEAVQLITTIQQLVTGYEEMSRYHQYSNESSFLRALGEKEYKKIQDLKVSSLILNTNYRNLILRITNDSQFSSLEKVSQNWLRDLQNELPKQELNEQQKKRYRELVKKEVEWIDEADKLSAEANPEGFLVPFAKFNQSLREDLKFKETFLDKSKTYKRKGDKIQIPSSDLIPFLCFYNDSSFGNKIWTETTLVQKEKTKELIYKVLLARAEMADILGWRTYAEYQLKDSVLGGAAKARIKLLEIADKHRKNAEIKLATLNRPAGYQFGQADFFYYLSHLATSTISSDRFPEQQLVSLEINRAIPSLIQNKSVFVKINKSELVTYDQFRREMPNIPLPISPENLLFWKYYDNDNNFIGYKVKDRFTRKNKYEQPSSWHMQAYDRKTKTPFLVYISTHLDPPESRLSKIRLKKYEDLDTEIHEDGHFFHYAMSHPHHLLSKDSTEIPAEVNVFYFMTDHQFLDKMFPNRSAQVYDTFTKQSSDPVLIQGRAEYALRNLNYHSFTWQELRTMKNMDEVEKKVYAERTRVSLFSSGSPDGSSFADIPYMFRDGKADLHRYVILNDLKYELTEILKGTSDVARFRRALIDNFIVPTPERSREDLYSRLARVRRVLQ